MNSSNTGSGQGRDSASHDCLFRDYVPEKFCREFVDFRGHSKLIFNYMAVVLEIKPMMDDWIPVGMLDDFIGMCGKKYGLHVRHGAVWLDEASDEYIQRVQRGHLLTTTKFIGAEYSREQTRGNVHVFISKSIDNLEKGYRTGWYPLIINNSVIYKPFSDHIRFGAALGYPQCCVDYFLRKNTERNFLHNIWKATTGDRDPHCNCLAKDTAYSYIYHMPCSFNCPETIRYVKNLKEEIRKQDPEYVKMTDYRLGLPFLVFEEQFIYVFEGELNNEGDISYTQAHFVGQPRYDRYSEIFAMGDRVKVRGRSIAVMEGGRTVRKIEISSKNKAFTVKFG